MAVVANHVFEIRCQSRFILPRPLRGGSGGANLGSEGKNTTSMSFAFNHWQSPRERFAHGQARSPRGLSATWTEPRRSCGISSAYRRTCSTRWSRQVKCRRLASCAVAGCGHGERSRKRSTVSRDAGSPRRQRSSRRNRRYSRGIKALCRASHSHTCSSSSTGMAACGSTSASRAIRASRCPAPMEDPRFLPPIRRRPPGGRSRSAPPALFRGRLTRWWFRITSRPSSSRCARQPPASIVIFSNASARSTARKALPTWRRAMSARLWRRRHQPRMRRIKSLA